MRSLNVSSNGRQVGVLLAQDDIWSFEYSLEWASDNTTFDLSPVLARSDKPIIDGATSRPVQWYFDNLLPEEEMRSALAKEAKVNYEDAFGLLEYLGKESAGSLVLLPPGADEASESGFADLRDEELADRIKNLPTSTLTSKAPKIMSVAGAQHKLLVIYADSRLYEPLGLTASTHILKPNHIKPDLYPSSVINEYAMMKLARRLGLNVPDVHRHYCPAPVYIVDRFDRVVSAPLPANAEKTTRLHLVDTCQLLNKSRSFKYTAANLLTLSSVIQQVRVKGPARIALYRWLVFNMLIGNNDNHLKNISYLIDHEGIKLAPFYDLLSTTTYLTTAYAGHQGVWPHVDLAIPLAGQPRFGDVTFEGLIEAGLSIGLSTHTCHRELNAMTRKIGPAMDKLIMEVEAENQELPDTCAPDLGEELRLLRTIRHVVIADMVGRLVP